MTPDDLLLLILSEAPSRFKVLDCLGSGQRALLDQESGELYIIDIRPAEFADTPFEHVRPTATPSTGAGVTDA